MSRFSDTYIAQYGGSELFTQLKSLHYYWFMINGLQNKYSDIAHRYLENFKAQFYETAQLVLNEMLDKYKQWVFDHSEEGRIKSWEEYFESGDEGSIGYVINLIKGNHKALYLLKTKIEEALSSDMDWYGDFLGREFSHNAQEFLNEKYKIQTSDDEDALQYIKENGLEEDYYEYAVSTGIYEKHFDVSDIYGNEWMEEIDQDLLYSIILRNPEILKLTYQGFKSQWGTWEESFNQVSETVKNLESVNIQDINGTMSTISLALNVAHNNGEMWEHLDIGGREMTMLSNLDTSQWEQQLSSFARIKYYHG